MPRIAYVNGRYVAHADACVHIEDRGYQFADGVYEVCEVARGYIMDMTRHLDRLDRSLGELSIAWPMSARRAGDRDARGGPAQPGHERAGLPAGDARRGAAATMSFPAGTKPSLVVTAKRTRSGRWPQNAPKTGIKVITVPENRWDRVDIKTVGLLPNVLAKQKAKEAGAQEAWFVDPDGTVKEGAIDQRLDRHPRRRAGDPAGRPRHPARHHPHDAVRRRGQARAEDRGARLLRRRGQGRARGLHHGGDHGRRCRSSPSTATRSPTAIPARWHFPCGRHFLTLRKKG